MRQVATRSRRRKVLRALFSGSLVLFLAVDHAALGQDSFGEVVDVSSGFARVTVANETDRPQAGDFRVSWKGKPQNVREVLGGPDSSIEVGIAVDLSASMQRSLRSMKAALGEFVRTELSAADRVFVVAMSDRIDFVSEGLEASLSSIANLSIDRRPGDRPTRFFDGVDGALSYFRNSSARAVLLVASDGCDSLQAKGAGERILNRASNLAIPVVLIAPGRGDCRNTTCKLTPSGEWNCSDVAPNGLPIRLRERDVRDPTRGPIEVSAVSLSSQATIARERFVGRLKAGGGGFLLARSDAEWSRGIDSVRSLLDRQWTVVFEPSSAAVRSSEVRVKFHRRSRPASSADSAAESRQETAEVSDGKEAMDAVSSPPAPSAAAPVAGNPRILGEQIDVELVNVDLVATDRRGRRILDLSRDELRLEVDGKPRPFDYFSRPRGFELGNAEPRESPPPQVASASGGTIFLVLDRTTLEARVLKQVVDSFKELVSAPGSTGKTFVVASFADSPILHTPGSSDRDEVDRALDDVVRAGARGTLRRLERRQLEGEVRSANRTNIDLLILQIQALEDQEVARQAAFVAMIQDLVSTSADPEEPNTLLIASEGFSAEPERYLRDVLSSVAGRGAGMLLSSQAAPPAKNVFVLAALDDLVTTAQECRVTAYTLIPPAEVTGPFSAESRTSGRFTGATPRAEESLAESAANVARLADATGGSRIPIFSDLKKRIDAIALDQQASYSLGFTTGPEAGFESHKIRIAASRSGVSLRYRTSFRRLSPADQWQTALAAAARSGIVNSALPIALRVESAAVPSARKGEGRKVLMILDIPLTQLSFQSAIDGSTDKSVLTIQLAISDFAGTLTRGAVETIEISIPTAKLEQARDDSWIHRTEVVLPAGRAGVGALVVEKSTGAWATASFTIPADQVPSAAQRER